MKRVKFIFCVFLMIGREVCGAAAGEGEVPKGLRLIHRLLGHTALVRAALYSSVNKCLFTGSNDTTIRAWDIKSGECLRVYEGNEAPVTCLADVGEATFVSGAENGMIIVWDAQDGGWYHQVDVDQPIRCMSKTAGDRGNWIIGLDKGKRMLGNVWNTFETYTRQLWLEDAPVDTESYCHVVTEMEKHHARSKNYFYREGLEEFENLKKLSPDGSVHGLAFLWYDEVALRDVATKSIKICSRMNPLEVIQEIPGYEDEQGAVADLPDGGLALACPDGTVDLFFYKPTVLVDEEKKDGEQ